MYIQIQTKACVGGTTIRLLVIVLLQVTSYPVSNILSGININIYISSLLMSTFYICYLMVKDCFNKISKG